MKYDIMELPDQTIGDWAIETFMVSPRKASFFNLREAINGRRRNVRVGSYKKLTYKNTTIMSNTPAELDDFSPFVEVATGELLINGLGLGCVLAAVLNKPTVTSVTVVEAAPDVIQLVGPYFFDDPRLLVVNANALRYQPPRGARYAAVWHDIWDTICEDNLPDMKRLHRKYARRTPWQGSWGRELL